LKIATTIAEAMPRAIVDSLWTFGVLAVLQ
jgi:hypothetical protein